MGQERPGSSIGSAVCGLHSGVFSSRSGVLNSTPQSEEDLQAPENLAGPSAGGRQSSKWAARLHSS